MYFEDNSYILCASSTIPLNIFHLHVMLTDFQSLRQSRGVVLVRYLLMFQCLCTNVLHDLLLVTGGLALW